MAERHHLLEIFQLALLAAEGRAAVRSWLAKRPPDGVACRAIAIGKAGYSMMQGAFDVLGERIERALVATKYGHCGWDPRINCREAAHPEPDAGGLENGLALLAFLDEMPPGMPLLFLISGGTSALVEVLPEGVSLEGLAQANHWLLSSGGDIGQVNRIRKAISCIKGGRLARRVAGRPVVQLMISDVPGDDPSIIGSGLLVPDPRADEPLPVGQLPDWLRQLVGCAPEPPSPGDAVFSSIRTAIIACNAKVRRRAAEVGRRLGYGVTESGELLEGDAVAAGERLARQLVAASPGLYVWGGETTVKLPPQPGRGGRCQSLALAAARIIAGRDDITLLAAGTDGNDGPTDDAGALVDGGTLERGSTEGLEIGESLDRADAGSFLEASGDLIQGGPTGTNVMDLVLAIKR